MSREIKKAIDHPMTQRTESGVSACYETKVFFGIGQRGVKGHAFTGEITWIPEGQCWRNCEAFDGTILLESVRVALQS